VLGCAASGGHLEEDLFGGPRARGPRAGALGRAGTVVLREVADLPASLQARLAELLRERHAGGQAVGARVVATTARDLRELAHAGAFRADLLYRLDVHRIVVPPLRERGHDVQLLCDHFAELARGAPLDLSDPARELLAGYAWPGNVLELQNEVQRLCALGAQRIGPAQLSPEVRAGRGVSRAAPGLSGRTLPEVEREMLVSALDQAGGNKARAARQLGIPRTSLYGLMQRHGLV
jgi:two-component system NtrC family response regulator